MGNTFANESFMDELAFAAGTDPLELRLRHLDDPRARAVLRAAADRFGWQPRTQPSHTITGQARTRLTPDGYLYTLGHTHGLAWVEWREGFTNMPQEAGAGLVIQVNGQARQVVSTPDTPLLYVLRQELALHGPKFGCGLAQCGACTVHIDGRAVRSCRFPLRAVGSSSVTTLEGLGGAPGQMHPLQAAFIQEQAAQCGYCTNGMIMQAASFLAANPAPTDAEIRAALSNNLCRCGSHLSVMRAVKAAAGVSA